MVSCCLLETRQRAKWIVVAEREARWVTFDLNEPYSLSNLHTPSQQKQKMTVYIPLVFTACRISPSFLATPFLSPTKFRLTPEGTNKEKKMLHSIFPSLLLWGTCKMRSSQYYMRSIPNSLCSLQAELDLTMYCILNTSTVKWIQEALSSHQLGVCHVVFL